MNILPNAKINLFGLPITIESKRGTYRTGKDANGIPWATKLDSDYGYIRRTAGADGEQIDCYIGQNPHSELVYVINQKYPTGRFDEHKVMLGYDSKDAAIQSYLANNPKAKNLFDSMEILTLPQFKQWLMTGSKQRKMEINVVKFKASLAEKLLMKANGPNIIKEPANIRNFEIKSNVSLGDMFTLSKSELLEKRALFELNRRIHLARSFKKKVLTVS